MRIKRYIGKIAAATMIASGLTFVPQIYHLPIMTVAHAEIKTCTGTGEYIGSMKETPEFAIQNAKIYAERAAIEEAGVWIGSYSKAVKSRLTEDEIVTFVGGMVSISTPKVEPIPLTGEAEGYIKYRVTITAKVDTNSIEEALNKWLS